VLHVVPIWHYVHRGTTSGIWKPFLAPPLDHGQNLVVSTIWSSHLMELKPSDACKRHVQQAWALADSSSKRLAGNGSLIDLDSVPRQVLCGPVLSSLPMHLCLEAGSLICFMQWVQWFDSINRHTQYADTVVSGECVQVCTMGDAARRRPVRALPKRIRWATRVMQLSCLCLLAWHSTIVSK